MSTDYSVAKEEILQNFETGLTLGPNDLNVISETNQSVLLTNYLTLKGSAFSSLDRECWKYLVSYNFQYYTNWDLEEISEINLKDISYVNDTLIKVKNNNFTGFIPALDKTDLSPITLLACFLWDRMNIYSEHNRDLPVTKNTDPSTQNEWQFRVSTALDLKTESEYMSDLPLFRGKAVVQPISMNTVTKQYAKASKLSNTSYKKNNFFTKLVDPLYTEKRLVHRDLDKNKLLEFLNLKKNIIKPKSGPVRTSMNLYPIPNEIFDQQLEHKLIEFYTREHKLYYSGIDTSIDEEIEKFQTYRVCLDYFQKIFPHDQKLCVLLVKHLLIGVPLIYTKLPHGLIRSSFTNLKGKPGFNVYWDKVLSRDLKKLFKLESDDENLVDDEENKVKTLSTDGKDEVVVIQPPKTKNLRKKLGIVNESDAASIDVLRLTIYKEIYENCNDFTEFKEYLLAELLKNNVEVSKNRKNLGKKRKSDETFEPVVEDAQIIEAFEDEDEVSDDFAESEQKNDRIYQAIKRVKKSKVVKLPKTAEPDEKENNNIINDLPALKSTRQPAAEESDKEEIDPELKSTSPAEIQSNSELKIPKKLNEVSTVSQFVIDWFSPLGTQVTKLDRTYKAQWRSKEPLKSQYEFQKLFASTYKKLIKDMATQRGITDLNDASVKCAELLELYIQSKYNGDLKKFIKFLGFYQKSTGNMWYDLRALLDLHNESD